MSVTNRGVRAACFTLAAAGLLSAAAYANTSAKTSSNNPVVLQGKAHQALFSVAFDGDRGVAVGAMGELLESSDGGKSWNGSGSSVG
ncbi:hypothetical protein [Hydrocarboniphaga effusa]|uniref:hypothetical protein n=1 Tax=Hydrocarboniphaga effusa TaxID=243629 RepID=UPI0012FC7B80|nr:hypothetical protein [Hydrocarboniphaga effusa]